MLIGLIADVHSNAVALEAVLSDMDCAGVDKILHAGDLIGYNPYPDATIELFKKREIVSIRGNHDRALISGNVWGFNTSAATALSWTQKVIGTANFRYISGLKDIEINQCGEVNIVILHGSPRDIDEYVYPEDVDPEFLLLTNADVLVLGHTHIQFKKEYPGGIIVNPGSVGQPRDLNPESGFAILDTDTRQITLKRKKYDIEKVVEDMHKAHLPERLALRLREGR